MYTTKQRGFTLIEMMITVAIIGILAAIAIPNYSRYLERGHFTVAKAYLTSMRQQMEAQYLKTGKRDTLPGNAPNHEEYILHFNDVTLSNDKKTLTAVYKKKTGVEITMNVRTGKFTCEPTDNASCKSIFGTK